MGDDMKNDAETEAAALRIQCATRSHCARKRTKQLCGEKEAKNVLKAYAATEEYETVQPPKTKTTTEHSERQQWALTRIVNSLEDAEAAYREAQEEHDAAFKQEQLAHRHADQLKSEALENRSAGQYRIATLRGKLSQAQSDAITANHEYATAGSADVAEKSAKQKRAQHAVTEARRALSEAEKEVVSQLRRDADAANAAIAEAEAATVSEIESSYRLEHALFVLEEIREALKGAKTIHSIAAHAEQASRSFEEHRARQEEDERRLRELEERQRRKVAEEQVRRDEADSKARREQDEIEERRRRAEEAARDAANRQLEAERRENELARIRAEQREKEKAERRMLQENAYHRAKANRQYAALPSPPPVARKSYHLDEKDRDFELEKRQVITTAFAGAEAIECQEAHQRQIMETDMMRGIKKYMEDTKSGENRLHTIEKHMKRTEHPDQQAPQPPKYQSVGYNARPGFGSYSLSNRRAGNTFDHHLRPGFVDGVDKADDYGLLDCGNPKATVSLCSRAHLRHKPPVMQGPPPALTETQYREALDAVERNSSVLDVIQEDDVVPPVLNPVVGRTRVNKYNVKGSEQPGTTQHLRGLMECFDSMCLSTPYLRGRPQVIPNLIRTVGAPMTINAPPSPERKRLNTLAQTQRISKKSYQSEASTSPSSVPRLPYIQQTPRPPPRQAF